MHHQFRLSSAPYRYRMEGLLSHRLPFFIGTSERAPGSKDAGEADPRHSIPLSPNSQKILIDPMNPVKKLCASENSSEASERKSNNR